MPDGRSRCANCGQEAKTVVEDLDKKVRIHLCPKCADVFVPSVMYGHFRAIDVDHETKRKQARKNA